MAVAAPFPAEVLLVEDNSADIELTRRAFDKSSHDVNFDFVTNGEDCLNRLKRQTGYVDAPRPDLILLDVNMPGMSGHEVLEKIRADEELQTIPVVMLSTSQNATDVERSYRLSCNSYVTKPIGFHELQRLINELNDYWFNVVALPPK